MNFLDKNQSLIYALLRFGSGAMFAAHGAQKVLGLLGASAQPVASQLWLGGVIELLCGVLIALGFHTRWAAFLASGTMAVAYIQFHWKLQPGLEMLPIVNRGELALLYSLVFLYLASRGGVAWCFNKK